MRTEASPPRKAMNMKYSNTADKRSEHSSDQNKNEPEVEIVKESKYERRRLKLRALSAAREQLEDKMKKLSN